jgi:RES domain-containing protein
MKSAKPLVERDGTYFTAVRGTFYRAVDPEYREDALAGSRTAGRFSPPDVPTLYVSSSPEGVEAAMIAHIEAGTPPREVLAFDIVACRIADLRDRTAMTALGVDPEAAAAPWQDDVVSGRRPASWRVRDALVERGALGLIDPSRKHPGLWHLTLFSWNRPGAASVRTH